MEELKYVPKITAKQTEIKSNGDSKLSYAFNFQTIFDTKNT